MLSVDQFDCFHAMCAVGHHLNDECVDPKIVDNYSLADWKRLKYGNPEFNRTTGPFSKLTETCELVMGTTLSYQEFFINDLEDLSKGNAQLDGLPGPITQRLVGMPRCGEPDYFPGSNAAVLQANWPTPCRFNLTWSIKPGFQVQGISNTRCLLLFREATNNLMKDLKVKFIEEQAKYPNTKFYERPAEQGGNVLARHLLAHNLCDTRVWGEYDISRSWSEEQFVTVITHEMGHGLGMNHVSQSTGGTLTPAINRQAMSRRGRFNEADFRQATKIGYERGDGTLPDGPDTPPPPPIPQEGVYLFGVTEVRSRKDDSVLGEFVYRPKIRTATS